MSQRISGLCPFLFLRPKWDLSFYCKFWEAHKNFVTGSCWVLGHICASGTYEKYIEYFSIIMDLHRDELFGDFFGKVDKTIHTNMLLLMKEIKTCLCNKKTDD